MKNLYLLLFLVCCSLQGEAVTLTDCLQIARRHNNKIEKAKEQILYAQAQKRQNLSVLLPRFDIDGRYEMKNKSQDYSVFTEFGSSFSTKTIGMNSTFLIFDFFSAWNGYKANRVEESISRKNLEKVFVELDNEVALAYFQVLENISSLQVMEDSINSLQKQLDSVEKSVKEGIASKKDLIMLKLLIAEQKKFFLKANTDALQSRMHLNHFLGKDPLSELEITNNFDSYPKYSLQQLRQKALSNNLDIQILKEKIEALQYSVKSSSNKNAPNIYLFGAYYYLEDSPPPETPKNKENRNWISGGLGLKFPLYDGGSNSAETKKRKSMLNQSKIELAERSKTVVMEVTEKYLQSVELEKKFII